MGRILLVFRLARSDLRRHPGQAAMLLLSLTVATGMLALGGSRGGATETLYRHTRAVTAGPDVVAVSPDNSAATARTQAALTSDPAVAAHSGPYLQYYAKLSAKGSTSHVVVMAADAERPARPHRGPPVRRPDPQRRNDVSVTRICPLRTPDRPAVQRRPNWNGVVWPTRSGSRAHVVAATSWLRLFLSSRSYRVGSVFSYLLDEEGARKESVARAGDREVLGEGGGGDAVLRLQAGDNAAGRLAVGDASEGIGSVARHLPVVGPADDVAPAEAAAVSTSSRCRSGDDVASFIRGRRRTPGGHFPHQPQGRSIMFRSVPRKASPFRTRKVRRHGAHAHADPAQARKLSRT